MVNGWLLGSFNIPIRACLIWQYYFYRFTLTAQSLFQIKRQFDKLGELILKVTYESDPIPLQRPQMEEQVKYLIYHLIKRWNVLTEHLSHNCRNNECTLIILFMHVADFYSKQHAYSTLTCMVFTFLLLSLCLGV